MKNSKGFSMTEALVAVALVGVAITIFGYLINSFSMARKGQINSAAINYARTVIDSTVVLWRRNEFYTKDTLPQNLPNPPNGFIVLLKAGSHPVYTRANPCSSACWSPATLLSPDLSTAKTLAVTVKDSSGTTLLSLETVVAKPLP